MTPLTLLLGIILGIPSAMFIFGILFPSFDENRLDSGVNMMKLALLIEGILAISYIPVFIICILLETVLG